MKRETIMIPKLSTPANYYETVHWKEDKAGRRAAQYCRWEELEDIGINVKWICEFMRIGPESPYTLARLAYIAGVAAGKHRERQRRKHQEMEGARV